MEHPRVAAIGRQDFAVADEALLIESARRLKDDPGLDDPVSQVRTALVLLIIEHGVDGLADRAGEFGLGAESSTTVLVDDPAAEDTTWLEAFPGAGRIVHQREPSPLS